MQRLAEAAIAISKTSSRLKKVALLSEYLRSLTDDDLRAAAVFFTGRPFPLTDARTLSVGWAALLRSIQEISGASDDMARDAYLVTGDLGEAAARMLSSGEHSEWTPTQVRSVFDKLAET